MKRAFLLLFLLITVATAWSRGSMSGTSEELEALQSLEQQKLIRLREQARAIIRENPRSFAGQYLMGYSLHHSEGDLPRAKFHLEKARQLFITIHGRSPGYTSPWGWYERTLMELEMVNAEMDLYDQQIKILDEYCALSQALFNRRPHQAEAAYAWPLMKLGREKEARQRLQSVASFGDEMTRAIYWNTKGALEMETGHPKASYEAFTSLISEIKFRRWNVTCTYLRNAGEAAASIGKFDEAERFFQEASRYFDPYSFSNPYWDLTSLYLAQGRFAEATEALKRCHEWSFRSRPYLAQQSWAANQHITCETLLQLGYTDKALEIARRFVSRPDRQGGDSVHKDQWEAGNLMMFRATLLQRAQALDEERCYTKGKKWWELLLQSQRLRAEAGVAQARASAIVASHDRLAKSLRYSYAPGTVMMPNWHRPELVTVYGAGTAEAALQTVYESKSESLHLEKPYLDIIQAEVERLRGDEQEAIRLLEDSLKTLPPSEATLRARAQATLGKLYERQGLNDKALASYLRVLDSVPGMVRFLDISLPVVIDDSGNPNLAQVRRMLFKSPRFHSGQGLAIRLSTTGASLAGTVVDPNGTVFARVEVKVEGELDQNLRDLAAEIHRKTFAPKVNLSQKDLTSLDGTNLSGTTQSEKLKDQFFGPGSEGPKL